MVKIIPIFLIHSRRQFAWLNQKRPSYENNALNDACRFSMF